MPKRLATDVRLTHFADLSPSSTYQAVSEWLEDEGELYEVVAVAVAVAEFVHEPEQKTQYYYYGLDGNADEIADRGPFEEAGEALAMLRQDAPNVEWEPLAADDSLTEVRDRLRRSPS